MALPFTACYLLAATLYHLPPRVLPSIQSVEGGRPGVVHVNRDGSVDLGIMQINTLWLTALETYTKTPQATVRQRLLHEDCYNIVAAGWILRTYLDEARGDLLQAVGYYHSHTVAIGQGYRIAVVGAARRLFAAPASR